MQQIVSALDKARHSEDYPIVIIAKTVKGYGIDRVENKEGFHGKAFTPDQLKEILPQFEQRFASAAANGSSFKWEPQLPENKSFDLGSGRTDRTVRGEPVEPLIIKESHYKKGEMIARATHTAKQLQQWVLCASNKPA